jgi:uncharacterized protein YbcV (DUF1398 family)
MQDSTRAAIRTTFDASNAGTIHFGEVIGRLVALGVESYHVDYRAGRSTYFMPDGASLDLPFNGPSGPVADAFDAAAVRAAVVDAQQGRVMYPQFKELTRQAGCAGYTVWIAGRHVSYFGRRGETHVERFPD